MGLLKGPEWLKIVNVESKRHDGDNVGVFVKTDGNQMQGLVILCFEPEQLTVVNIVGVIDPAQVRSLNGRLGIPMIWDDDRPKKRRVTRTRRNSVVKTLSIALLIVSGMSASAGDKADKPDDFKTIVKRVEQYYGKEHMKVPLMGLVSFASHFTRPVGASDFKLAIIEGVDRPDDQAGPVFNPGAEWSVVIRTMSRRGDQVVDVRT